MNQTKICDLVGRMASLLLDSNALVFYLGNSPRIGKKTRIMLDEAQIFFSAISLVELKIKMLQGKLKGPEVDQTKLIDLGLSPIGFGVEDASAFDLLPNQDPFDNMLLAQAKQRNLKFLTSDLKILSLDTDFVLDLTD